MSTTSGSNFFHDVISLEAHDGIAVTLYVEQSGGGTIEITFFGLEPKDRAALLAAFPPQVTGGVPNYAVSLSVHACVDIEITKAADKVAVKVDGGDFYFFPPIGGTFV